MVFFVGPTDHGRADGERPDPQLGADYVDA